MRERKSTLIEITLLGLLGGLALLSLVGPQLFRDRAAPQLLSLSVLLRDTDSSGWTVSHRLRVEFLRLRLPLILMRTVS